MPLAVRIGWVVFVLALLTGLYLFLRTNPGGWAAATFGVFVVVGMLLGNLVGHGVRRARRKRGEPASITLPWYLLRRAVDVALLVTIGFGFYAGISSRDLVQQAGSMGTLTFPSQSTQATDTVELPAGDVAVWFAVHCSTCEKLNSARRNDWTQFPAQTTVQVTGPATATVDYLSGVQAFDEITSDVYGIREQKRIALLHVAAPGDYTIRVAISPNYYELPAAYYSPLVTSYTHERILLGQRQPYFLDDTRLEVITALLALSVLIGLRPRSTPIAGYEPVSVGPPGTGPSDTAR